LWRVFHVLTELLRVRLYPQIDGMMKRGHTLQCGPAFHYSVDLRIFFYSVHMRADAVVRQFKYTTERPLEASILGGFGRAKPTFLSGGLTDWPF